MTAKHETVALIGELGNRALEFSQVADELRNATNESNADAMRPFRFAFDYALLPSSRSDSLRAFVPMLGYSDGYCPVKVALGKTNSLPLGGPDMRGMPALDSLLRSDTRSSAETLRRKRERLWAT